MRGPLSDLKLPEIWAPLFFFALMLAFACSFGLTDDEAYYWVLAQNPALGYAYHPPAVAWLITASQWLLGWVFGSRSVGLVRIPGILCAALVLGMGIKWTRVASGKKELPRRAVAVLLGFAAFFSLSWMMVPDLPLFLGWTLAFVATWKACHAEVEGGAIGALFGVFTGAALTMLSKYSGLLIWPSVLAAAWLWAPRARFWKIAFAVSIGLCVGFVPSILWNARHEWVSILYQIRDRHEGGFSLLRWGKFWAVELLLAGPALLGFALGVLPATLASGLRLSGKMGEPRALAYAALWMAPALLVYGLQPLMGDFKPHWALIAWWPAALGLAVAAAHGERRLWFKTHLVHGASLAALILFSCEWPLMTWVGERISAQGFDPRLDVTNDLYGWAELPGFLDRTLDPGTRSLPVVSSRYQTAAQAWFALGEKNQVTLLPQGIRKRDEWPSIPETEGVGPEWPKLRSPVLYVTDNRYDIPPSFPGARCEPVAKLEALRFSLPVKWIALSRCQPAGARP